jgi:hypothetical protein
VAEIAQLRSLINEVEYSTKSSRNTSPTRRQYGGGVSPTRSLHSMASAAGSEVPSRSTSPVNANDAGSRPLQRRVSFAKKDRKQTTSPGQKRSLKRRSDFASIMMPNTRPNARLQTRATHHLFSWISVVFDRYLIGTLSCRLPGYHLLEFPSPSDTLRRGSFEVPLPGIKQILAQSAGQTCVGFRV